MTLMGKLFVCNTCRGVFGMSMLECTVSSAKEEYHICKACDIKIKEKHDNNHCKISDKEVQKLKRVRDPDTRKMMNVCQLCFKEIKH